MGNRGPQRQTLPAGDLTVMSLATIVADELGVPQADGLKAVQAVLGAIGRTVAAGHRVRLNNFGSFEPSTRRVRSGVLKTPDGDEHELKARPVKTIKFTARGHLREVLQDRRRKYRGIARTVTPRVPRQPVGNDFDREADRRAAEDTELSA